MNVLKYFPYRPSYYIKRPWAFVGQAFRNLKCGIERMIKGYSWFDAYDADSYILDVLTNLIIDVRKYQDEIIDISPERKELWDNVIRGLNTCREFDYKHKEEHKALLRETFSDLGENIHDLWI